MAVNENSGTMKYKDGSGNINVLYPITKAANVEGLDDLLPLWLEYTTSTPTFTFAEVYAALKAGRPVFAKKSGNVYTVMSYDSDFIFFHSDATSRDIYISNGSTAYWTEGPEIRKATEEYVDDAINANKTTVDSAMSTTSTNPVQNKIVAAAIDSAIKSAIQNTWEASY